MIEQKIVINMVLSYISPSKGAGLHMVSVEAKDSEEAAKKAKEDLIETIPDIDLDFSNIIIWNKLEINANLSKVTKDEPVEMKIIELDKSKLDYLKLSMLLRDEKAKTKSEKSALNSIIKRLELAP